MEPPNQVQTAPDTTVTRGALTPGVRLRQYEIRSVLGQGGFGITYLGRDLTLHRDVAIKEYLPTTLALREAGETVVPRSTATAADFLNGRERFLDEARTLARLDNMPAIVRVLDFLEANGTAYMVMALARGETLAARLRREGPLSAEAIHRMLPSLLEGLEGVHGAGFLHRDIKPANILIDQRGLPTLIDFGAARAALAGTSVAMTAVFTPGYAAAEQMTSAKQGPWTDIYGLAATLHHAIIGYAPPSAFDRVLDDTYVPLTRICPAGFGAGLLAAIDAGLAVRASDRPQSIAAWRPMLLAQGPVTTANGGATVSLPQTPPAAQFQPKAPPAEAAPVVGTPLPARKTRITLYAGAAAVLLLALGGGGYFLFLANPQPKPVALQDLKVEDLERALAERRKADAEAAEKQRQADEAQRKAEVEAAAKQRADADLDRARAERQKAEEELAQLKAQIEARRKEAAEQKQAADAAAQRAAEEEAKRKAQAEMAALQAAEEQAKKKAADEASARQQAEAAQAKADAERKRADEAAAARAQAEADARAKADAEAKAKADAEAVETALHLATADRQHLQIALSAAGFDTHGSDGVFGPKSREMIAAWQKARGQPPTGFLTAAQTPALLKEPAVAAALAKFDADQKKLEEDKKKAEEEAKAAAAAAAAPAPAPPSVPQQQQPQQQPTQQQPQASAAPTDEKSFEQKQITLPNTAGTGCAFQNSWGLRIFPHRLALNIRGVWQRFDADASGQFSGGFQIANGNHFNVSGNLNSRTITFVNMSNNSCTFAGKF